MPKNQSVEPNIADLGNSMLKAENLDYRLEQEHLNSEIDKALEEYASKNGGKVAIGRMRNYYFLILTWIIIQF